VKVAILCGGLGTRLREETEFRPKPMVEVGGKPILWHIMRHYAKYGHHEFVLLLGYRGDVIRQYFLNFPAMNSDVCIDLGSQRVTYLDPPNAESRWTVTLAETGHDTLTAGRLLRGSRHFGGSTFLCTYGDGLSNVDLAKLLAFHREKGKLVTVTGVRPVSRFGELEVKDGVARRFREKPQLEGDWVNGGYFVMEPGAMRYLKDDIALESEPLARLTADGQLAVYQHEGYWMPMDTYRDSLALNQAWASGRPGWLDPPP
jgi:glucose-1-phosphate cytidylyltransferase